MFTKKLKNIVCGVFLILICSSAGAQELTIFDEESKTPIKHVQVDIKGKRVKSLFTDANGKLTLYGCEYSDTLIVNHVIYGKSEFSYKSLTDNNFTLYLKQNFFEMDPIDIINTREKAISTPQKVRTISQEEIRFESPANSASLLESSGQILVQKSQQGGGSPIIRGFEANRVLLSEWSFTKCDYSRS